MRGLRIDAAKHMPAADLAAIRSRLSDQSVYLVSETIGAPVKDSEYTGVGDVHEFGYAWDLKRVFTNEKLAYLSNFGEAWGHLASASANVFVDNHDTERNGETLNQTYGATYTLANVFMLGRPYGTPSVHSGYSFTGTDQGAPLNGDGTVADPTCYQNGWRCQHAWQPITGMVGFHNAVGDAAVTNWCSNGNNAIAWGRGPAGYVVVNREGGALNRTFQTSLPAGTDCDVVNGATTSTPPAGSPRPSGPSTRWRSTRARGPAAGTTGAAAGRIQRRPPCPSA